MLEWYDYLIIIGLAAAVWFALTIFALMNIKIDGKRVFSWRTSLRATKGIHAKFPSEQNS